MLYLVISVAVLILLAILFFKLESVWYNRRNTFVPLDSIMEDDEPVIQEP